MATTGGTLWVVATPIGNLEDFSPRARRVLSSVAVIAAEDTRHTRHLLQHFGISAPLLSLHEHNEASVVPQVVDRLRGGEDIALVSDAGTPLISDPGARLVAAAHAAGLRVSPVPGPAAVVTALSVAGLSSERFVFEGFLPSRPGPRRERLAALVTEARTLVFYEAPHRLEATLADLVGAFGGERQAAIARELTKVHETVLGGDLAQLSQRVAEDPDQRRGEIVLLVAGSVVAESASLAEGRRLFALLCDEMPPARAAKIAADFTGAPRRALYGRGAGMDESAADTEA